MYNFCELYLSIYNVSLSFTALQSVVQKQYIKNVIHAADPDDPLADLLDDLLPDEAKPESKPSIQRAKPVKSAPSPASSPILKTETREPQSFIL